MFYKIPMDRFFATAMETSSIACLTPRGSGSPALHRRETPAGAEFANRRSDVAHSANQGSEISSGINHS